MVVRRLTKVPEEDAGVVRLVHTRDRDETAESLNARGCFAYGGLIDVNIAEWTREYHMGRTSLYEMEISG